MRIPPFEQLSRQNAEDLAGKAMFRSFGEILGASGSAMLSAYELASGNRLLGVAAIIGSGVLGKLGLNNLSTEKELAEAFRLES